MHVKQAEVQLGSRIPWIADTMTNELKHALGNIPDSEFIIDPDGRVVARRAWSNPSQLRRDLERLIGPVKSPTLCRSSTWSPRRPCRRWPKASSRASSCRAAWRRCGSSRCSTRPTIPSR